MKTTSLLSSLRLLPVLAAALFVTRPDQATAATVVSNLANTSGGNLAVVYDSFPFPGGQIRANAFTTGSTAMDLNSVTLGMLNSFAPAGGFGVSIFSDGGILGPGTLLATLTGSADPSTAGAYLYTPGSALTLNASSTYYIVASVPQSGVDTEYRWSYTENGSETGASDWSIDNASWFSSNGGTSWTKFGFPSAGQFSVDATAVPEPSRALLLLCGLGLTCLRRRR